VENPCKEGDYGGFRSVNQIMSPLRKAFDDVLEKYLESTCKVRATISTSTPDSSEVISQVYQEVKGEGIGR
jgi:hypothetical protein